MKYSNTDAIANLEEVKDDDNHYYVTDFLFSCACPTKPATVDFSFKIICTYNGQTSTVFDDTFSGVTVT